MLLEVRGLKKSFKENVHAVRGVSFALERGEVLGLVGESGCGKSTLAKMVMRLTAPDSGEIFFHGKGMQIIFQNPTASFDPLMTLGASLEEALVIGGEKDKRKLRERSRALLESMDLPAGFTARYPRELSGGECQRVAIARALSREPELLICDEPVSSLDLLAQARILNLFLDIQKKRPLSLLFISHDLRVIRHLSDRVMVMKDGAICEEGPVSQVFENPQHPYTQELLVSSGIRPKA